MANLDVVYQDQSAKDLNLNVLLGNVDTSQFCVLETGRVILGNFQVTAGIIGASHFVIAQFRDRCVSEVFACTEIISDLPRIFFQPLKQGQGFRVHVTMNKIGYQFESIMAKLDSVFTKIAIQNNRNFVSVQKAREHEIGLYYRFPALNTDKAPPETIVLVEVVEEKKQVLLNSIHVYPNEGNAVHTFGAICF